MRAGTESRPCRPGRMLAALLVAALAAGPAIIAPAVAAAQSQDCSKLPGSARRPRTCNPQEECLKQIPASLTGQARESAERDCRRQPTSGVCYGPDTYNPQVECREREKKK